MIAYKEFYHCKKIRNEDERIIEFEAPVKKWGNYQPLDGYVDTLKYGESVNQKWRLIVSLHENDYTVGDLLYLDGDKPIPETKGYEYGDGANARVTAVKIGYKAVQVEIEQIIERND
jgi:hypothetical protein